MKGSRGEDIKQALWLQPTLFLIKYTLCLIHLNSGKTSI